MPRIILVATLCGFLGAWSFHGAVDLARAAGLLTGYSGAVFGDTTDNMWTLQNNNAASSMASPSFSSYNTGNVALDCYPKGTPTETAWGLGCWLDLVTGDLGDGAQPAASVFGLHPFSNRHEIASFALNDGDTLPIWFTFDLGQTYKAVAGCILATGHWIFGPCDATTTGTSGVKAEFNSYIRAKRSSAGSCSAALEGVQYYDTTLKKLRYCNGTSWVSL